MRTLERDRLGAKLIDFGVTLLAVLLAMVVGMGVIGAQGHDPLEVLGVLLSETLAQPLGLGQVLFKTTTLSFTGLAAAFAFRAGLFNIGGEGQLYLGAFTAALAGLALPAGVPPAVAIPIVVSAAMVGGALAAVIPAALKATRGTHEVISTMMMSFILLAAVNYFLSWIRIPETVRTAELPAGARLMLLSAIAPSLRGSDGNAALFLAFLASGAVLFVLARTRAGYELRAVGSSPPAAEYGGINVRRRVMLALVGSGALAGLGGVNFVMGSPGYFEQNFAPYQGYLGIAVALLARNQPLAVVPAALLFAVLAEGGQAIQQFVPREIGDILQAVVIVFVVVGARILEVSRRRQQQRRVAHA